MPGYGGTWGRLSQREKRWYQRNPHVACVCWICHRYIDPWLYHNHKDAFTLDHKVPRVHGGMDVLTNVRPAHRGCNTKRARAIDRLIKGQAVGQTLKCPVKSTREW
jgi:5-methylcytosine-specific restriction endonuclease McrA